MGSRACAALMMIGLFLSLEAEAKAPKLVISSRISKPLKTKIIRLTQKLWKSWEFRFQTQQPRIRIPVWVPKKDIPGNQMSQIKKRQIFISPSVTRKDFMRVYTHSLARVFFNEWCRKSKRSDFVAETFALWASQDYKRYLSQENTSFSDEEQALEWLEKAERPFKRTIVLEQAISRLIENRVGDDLFDDYYKKLFTSCGTGEDFGREWEALLTQTLGVKRPKVSKWRADYLLVDGQSLDVMAREGELETGFPPSEVIQPVLLSVFPELNQKIESKANIHWACPDLKTVEDGVAWSWDRALLEACNGFFLSGGLRRGSNWKEFERILARVGSTQDPKSINRSLGLRPGLSLSAWQLARLYDWVQLRSPDVVQAMRKIPESGNLSRLPEAKWFQERQIGLMGGTFYNSKGAAKHTWVVALGPNTLTGQSSYLAAIHSHGTSVNFLLEQLKARVRSLKPLRSAKVQVLELARDKTVSLRCATHSPLVMRDEKGAWQFSKNEQVKAGSLQQGYAYRCLGSPLLISYSEKGGGRTEKAYPGTLNVKAFSDTKKVSGLKEPTRYILETSERFYVYDTLVSEYPGGKLETLKLLAYLVRNNLYHAKDTKLHEGSIAKRIPRAIQLKAYKAVDAVLGDEIPEDSSWRHYYVSARPTGKTRVRVVSGTQRIVQSESLGINLREADKLARDGKTYEEILEELSKD